MASLPPAIFLMGPTAAGKTALAMALYEHLPVELISVDASQVYLGMDIGTAKPTLEERARVPHRLVDIRDPADPYSAADFCQDARREMDAIHQAGKIPLLVGGSMFYFRALENGLSALPSANSELREQLSAQAVQVGWPALHQRLRDLDPESAARINPQDAQRIQRALEIVTLTGKPVAAQTQAPRLSLPYRLIKLALVPAERRTLHDRIATRFHSMLEQGLVQEVETLFKRGDLRSDLPSVRTVGYRQVWQYLSEALSYQEMIERGIIATRQLAKRQYTWLRADKDIQTFTPDRQALTTAVVDYLTQQLDR